MHGHDQHVGQAATTLAKAAKAVGDTGAIGVAGGAMVGMLPEISAGLSGLWVLIRIWETDTVRELTGRKPARSGADD